jgi:hypothetical protein
VPLPSDALFDHTARVWVPTENVGRYRGVERSYAPGAVFDCRVTNPGRAQGQQGTGVSEVGVWKVFALAEGLDIQEKMVIQVLTGNEAPRNLYVDRAYEPRSIFGFIRRMYQVVCRQWDGVLDEAES